MAATKRSKKAEAFREGIGKVFLKYRQEIHKAAYGVTGNREDARDVLQKIFAKLIRGWPPKDFLKNPRGYLHKAAVNAARDIMRSRESQRLTDQELGSLNIAAPAIDWDREEDIGRMRAAMARMDPKTVEILNLRYKEGYTCREIAGIRGKPIGTVVADIFQARAELKRLIWIEEKNRETQQKEHQRNRKPLLADPSTT